MSDDLAKRLRELAAAKHDDLSIAADAADEIERLRTELHQIRNVLGFIETWICNPVSAYSVSALDGLFGMTRDKISELPKVKKEAGDD